MILPCRIRGFRNQVPRSRFRPLFAACFLLRSVKRWLNMGPFQERVLGGGERGVAWLVVGATFRFKSQPVWTSVMITTFSGAMPPRAEAAEAHFR